MDKKIKIGIGITTRNRQETLTYCITHLYDYTDRDKYDLCIVVNDDSDSGRKQETKNVVSDFTFSFDNINYITSVERCGIAKAKNKCLRYLMEQECEYLFLFDDDAFPQKLGWIELFIDAHKCSGSEHLMYLREVGVVVRKSVYDGCVEAYNNCLGVMLFYTANAIKKIGGYNERFGIYGFEHSDMSYRCRKAGLSGKYDEMYMTPLGVCDYIYSFDIDYNWHKKLPPIKLTEVGDSFLSSIHGEDVEKYVQHANNTYVNVLERPIYVKL